MEQKNKRRLFVALAVFLSAFLLGAGLFQVSWALPIIKKPTTVPPGFDELVEIQRCNNVKSVAGRKYNAIRNITNRDEEIYDNLILRMEDMSYKLSDLGYDISSLRPTMDAFRSLRSESDVRKDEVLDLLIDLQYNACSFTSEERKEKVKEIRDKVEYLQTVGIVIKREGWVVLNENINNLKAQR